jgi:hypothetical protein
MARLPSALADWGLIAWWSPHHHPLAVAQVEPAAPDTERAAALRPQRMETHCLVVSISSLAMMVPAKSSARRTGESSRTASTHRAGLDVA